MPDCFSLQHNNMPEIFLEFTVFWISHLREKGQSNASMILSNFNQNDDGYIIQQSWKKELIIKKVEISVCLSC